MSVTETRSGRVGVCHHGNSVLVNDQREYPSSSPPIKYVSQSLTETRSGRVGVCQSRKLGRVLVISQSRKLGRVLVNDQGEYPSSSLPIKQNDQRAVVSKLFKLFKGVVKRCQTQSVKFIRRTKPVADEPVADEGVPHQSSMPPSRANRTCRRPPRWRPRLRPCLPC